MTHRQRLSMIAVMVVAALGLSFTGASAAGAAPDTPVAAPPVTALATPITGTATDGGSFAGSFTPARFVARNGRLLATGVLSGTVRDPSGAPVGTVSRTVSLPVTVAAATCQVLDLVLGPLHLNLLGLVVDLNQVHLLITAVQAPGDLLGNLLCAITHLLDGAPAVGPLAALLNAVLALLGRL
ncbi:hypothetical protein ACWT_3989 [Actinoplanes sp. SE50]|uniref:hypothetical protein n=1 Tax=unclassified Actinoplanes TaxID=2626549 RepID=UPI00023ED609|nr:MULTISPECIES: hypothetical protein [unclassified Actinoplanes]AEV85013.1 hypothetical protein ACPL_4118 [Actinoplanes sp. SE50/110]ATO83404.1 hypothetical protein ACWT_3989 [Actinoplanes sp. SE50]SLM00811.1 hypothetical protein ACSP50_4044 [Actinoplanes sp. SE50/110]